MRRAALILFGAALILLLADLAITELEDPKTAPNRKAISKKEVDSLFIISLKNLGLTKESIQKRKKSNISYSYKINVSTDLSIPVLLAEINQVFLNCEVTINANEKSLNGLTVLNIGFDKLTVLEADLNYDDKIIRSKGVVAFVIDDFNLSSSNDSLLLDIPEPFSILLIPQTKSIELIEFFMSKQKSYSLLLNDDIPELKYKLNEGYSRSRIEGPLLSILKDFSGAASIFIDNQSDLYKSTALVYIQDEFSKRNIDLISLDKLITINNNRDNNLITDFDNIIKNTDEQKGKIIRVSREDFGKLLGEIKRYKKLGYKIVHPTELL
ncbi:hypothetical protein ACFLSS_00525 [Bacteroidota bacterium]